MKSHALAIWTLSFLAVVSSSQAGQQQESQKRQKETTEMAAPKPGQEMERLKFLLGSWDTSAKYEKTAVFPNGGTTTGRYVARLGPGGFSQIADFVGSGGPEGDIAGHEVITWDPKENAYKSYVFGNNFPGAFIRNGHWEDNALAMTTEFTQGDQKFVFRSVTKQISAGNVTIQESYSLNGSPMQLLYSLSAAKRM